MGQLLKLTTLFDTCFFNCFLSGTLRVFNGPIMSHFQENDDHKLRCDSNPRTTRAHFTGSIPPEIGALVALTRLDLSYTDVEGASRGLIQIS